MGSPYLNSGETIVLTTNRVVAEGVSYDVMLTSERIFLIDSRMARLEPRIIPLSTILAVQGGKTPAQEPVITIVFREKREGERTPPLNLLFSQTPNENRKPERDDWVRGLIRLSIHVQEMEREPEKPVVPPAPRETGLRPMARHGIAPDMVRPLSNVADRTQPVPVMVIPEEIPGSGEIPIPGQADVREKTVTSAPKEIPEVPATYLSPVRGRPLPPPPPHTRVIIPQIIEELLPEKEKPAEVVPEAPVFAPAVIIDQEALFRTIPVSLRPLTVTEERAPVPSPAEEIAPEPDSGTAEPDNGAPEPVPEPDDDEEKELPEILKALYTGPREPVAEEKEETASDIPEPETEGESAGEVVTASQVPEPETEGVSAGEVVTASQVPEPETDVEKEEGKKSASRIPQLAATGTEMEPAAEDVRPEQEPVHRWSELFARKAESAPASTEPVHEPAEPADDRLNAEGGEPAEPEAAPEPPAPAEPPVTPVPEEVQPTKPEAAGSVPVRHPVPPAREIRPIKTTLAYAGVLIIVIALVIAGAFLLSRQGQGPADAPGTIPVTTLPPVTGTPTTTPQTTLTVLPVSTRPPVNVPQEGVWVRLTSTSEYYGNIGNTGMMRQVSGSGDTIHPIFWPDHPVLVSVQKKDNTGAVLTATVYRNGTAIGTRSVNSPMGTVEILIDPVTARAPGLSP